MNGALSSSWGYADPEPVVSSFEEVRVIPSLPRMSSLRSQHSSESRETMVSATRSESPMYINLKTGEKSRRHASDSPSASSSRFVSTPPHSWSRPPSRGSSRKPSAKDRYRDAGLLGPRLTGAPVAAVTASSYSSSMADSMIRSSGTGGSISDTCDEFDRRRRLIAMRKYPAKSGLLWDSDDQHRMSHFFATKRRSLMDKPRKSSSSQTLTPLARLLAAESATMTRSIDETRSSETTPKKRLYSEEHTTHDDHKTLMKEDKGRKSHHHHSIDHSGGGGEAFTLRGPSHRSRLLSSSSTISSAQCSSVASVPADLLESDSLNDGDDDSAEEHQPLAELPRHSRRQTKKRFQCRNRPSRVATDASALIVDDASVYARTDVGSVRFGMSDVSADESIYDINLDAIITVHSSSSSSSSSSISGGDGSGSAGFELGHYQHHSADEDELIGREIRTELPPLNLSDGQFAAKKSERGTSVDLIKVTDTDDHPLSSEVAIIEESGEHTTLKLKDAALDSGSLLNNNNNQNDDYGHRSSVSVSRKSRKRSRLKRKRLRSRHSSSKGRRRRSESVTSDEMNHSKKRSKRRSRGDLRRRNGIAGGTQSDFDDMRRIDSTPGLSRMISDNMKKAGRLVRKMTLLAVSAGSGSDTDGGYASAGAPTLVSSVRYTDSEYGGIVTPTAKSKISSCELGTPSVVRRGRLLTDQSMAEHQQRRGHHNYSVTQEIANLSEFGPERRSSLSSHSMMSSTLGTDVTGVGPVTLTKQKQQLKKLHRTVSIFSTIVSVACVFLLQFCLCFLWFERDTVSMDMSGSKVSREDSTRAMRFPADKPLLLNYAFNSSLLWIGWLVSQLCWWIGKKRVDPSKPRLIAGSSLTPAMVAHQASPLRKPITSSSSNMTAVGTVMRSTNDSRRNSLNHNGSSSLMSRSIFGFRMALPSKTNTMNSSTRNMSQMFDSYTHSLTPDRSSHLAGAGHYNFPSGSTNNTITATPSNPHQNSVPFGGATNPLFRATSGGSGGHSMSTLGHMSGKIGQHSSDWSGESLFAQLNGSRKGSSSNRTGLLRSSLLPDYFSFGTPTHSPIPGTGSTHYDAIHNGSGFPDDLDIMSSASLMGRPSLTPMNSNHTNHRGGLTLADQPSGSLHRPFATANHSSKSAKISPKKTPPPLQTVHMGPILQVFGAPYRSVSSNLEYSWKRLLWWVSLDWICKISTLALVTHGKSKSKLRNVHREIDGALEISLYSSISLISFVILPFAYCLWRYGQDYWYSHAPLTTKIKKLAICIAIMSLSLMTVLNLSQNVSFQTNANIENHGQMYEPLLISGLSLLSLISVITRSLIWFLWSSLLLDNLVIQCDLIWTALGDISALIAAYGGLQLLLFWPLMIVLHYSGFEEIGSAKDWRLFAGIEEEWFVVAKYIVTSVVVFLHYFSLFACIVFLSKRSHNGSLVFPMLLQFIPMVAFAVIFTVICLVYQNDNGDDGSDDHESMVSRVSDWLTCSLFSAVSTRHSSVVFPSIVPLCFRFTRVFADRQAMKHQNNNNNDDSLFYYPVFLVTFVCAFPLCVWMYQLRLTSVQIVHLRRYRMKMGYAIKYCLCGCCYLCCCWRYRRVTSSHRSGGSSGLNPYSLKSSSSSTMKAQSYPLKSGDDRRHPLQLSNLPSNLTLLSNNNTYSMNPSRQYQYLMSLRNSDHLNGHLLGSQSHQRGIVV